MGTRARHPLNNLLPVDIRGFDTLADLALDLRWSWNHEADELWRDLDPTLWELTQNPWIVLQTVSRDRIEDRMADPVFRRRVDDLLRAKEAAAATPGWFQQAYPRPPLRCVAYFSMEFMLTEALPIYSGGLGNVAGDQLKAASDLGIPVVGVGLLYQQGYFRQVIDQDGAQQAVFPYNDPGQLPITPLRQPNGEWLRLRLDLPGYPIWLNVWQVQLGRVKLYLLDSNHAANFPPYRGVTAELYVGTPHLRLTQEIILGIGGWRLLVALGIEPEVCHLNEGHAALAVLERARSFMRASGQTFAVALAVTRAGNLFTTHTAVSAGFDRFPPKLIDRYLGGYAREQLGIGLDDLLALGRQNRDDSSEDFNMAYLAIRGSGAVNGVSRLHGEVSRRLFQPLFPRWPADEVPVGHVTNGVHMPTWDSPMADALWTETCGKERWLGTTESLTQALSCASDERLWQLRSESRRSLVAYVRDRLSRQLAAAGAPPEMVNAGIRPLSGDVLTVGFARRFTAYKRPNLLLHDPERLLRLLTDPVRPMHLIIAGKAHPADQEGQAMIRRWVQFIRRPEVRPYAVFIPDDDMLLTEMLVQGVDVWLNTPRRPWEACGTSGMKALVNGGLNLSTLDGWWAEAYGPEVGWALGDGHGDGPAADAADAEALYDLLEREVIPAFYDRDSRGIPVAWVARMRESMARMTPRFSANRAVREYAERHYLPMAAAYRQRAAGRGALGVRLVLWRDALERQWPGVRFGEVRVEPRGGEYAFEVQLFLGELDPDAVRVELYAEPQGDAVPFRQAMRRAGHWPGLAGAYAYRARVPATRPATDYTARVLPHRDGLAVPLETARILWQR
ncbi:MAG: glgP [Rhodocyclaceae bacterium]|nr:glgP [Rhodocyclaceae bacterium]